MLIPKEPGPDKKTQFRIRMSEAVLQEISDYCQWTGIRVRDYFIEQACKYIFKNDADWQKYKEEQLNKIEDKEDQQ